MVQYQDTLAEVVVELALQAQLFNKVVQMQEVLVNLQLF